MIIPEETIAMLEAEGRRAVEAGDWAECRRISDRFFDLDPDCDMGRPYYLEGCTCMSEGDYMGAAASWVCALDHMEDIGEMEDMCEAVVDVCFRLSGYWSIPALKASSAVLTVSRASADLLGRRTPWMAAALVERMASSVPDGEAADRNRGDSAVALAAGSMVFSTDMRPAMEVVSSVADLHRRIREADGIVPEGPGVCDAICEEWVRATEGMTPEQIDEIAEYWSTRHPRIVKMFSDLVEMFRMSRMDSVCDADRRKRIRMFILKWLRVRKRGHRRTLLRSSAYSSKTVPDSTI